MIIGIDGSRAFLKQRTGIEEYAYQVIKYLTKNLSKNCQVVLYIRKSQKLRIEKQKFFLPENWLVKVIKWPYLWTQIGLSLEMFFSPVDVLFIPAHTIPLIHPKKTFVTIHGLEYEFVPKAYSFWERIYMRCSIKNSCRWAKKIIVVSKNTQNDLMKLYKIPKNKINVIYEGYNIDSKFQILNSQSQMNSKFEIQALKPYLFFIGRLEERKNIIGIIKAFEILKEKYSIKHKLILAGKKGYGYEDIKFKIQTSKFRKDIFETGFISEEEKWIFLKNADVFLFPTFYEGFGLPILEAQNMGIPTIAGNNSSMPEVVEESAILVNSQNVKQIAEAVYQLICNKTLRDNIIKKGHENVKRFSWEKCAQEIAKILIENNDLK